MISKRTLEGWYGEAAKQRALSKLKTRLPDGMILRCKCNTTQGVKFYDYKYLSQPGYYCPSCLAVERANTPKRISRAEHLNKILLEYC